MAYDSANDTLILVAGVANAADGVVVGEVTQTASTGNAYDSSISTTTNNLSGLNLDTGNAHGNTFIELASLSLAGIEGSLPELDPRTTSNNLTGLNLDTGNVHGNSNIELASLSLAGIEGSLPEITGDNVTNNFLFVALDQGSFAIPTESTTTTVTQSSRIQYWG